MCEGPKQLTTDGEHQEPESGYKRPTSATKENLLRWTCLPAIALLLASGCSAEHVSSSGDDGNCVSQYEPVADAPTLPELRRELLEDIDQTVRSLKVTDEHPDKEKVYVNLLNHRNRTVMALDMWQQDDGTWTAQQWSQCID